MDSAVAANGRMWATYLLGKTLNLFINSFACGIQKARLPLVDELVEVLHLPADDLVGLLFLLLKLCLEINQSGNKIRYLSSEKQY